VVNAPLSTENSSTFLLVSANALRDLVATNVGHVLRYASLRATGMQLDATLALLWRPPLSVATP